MRISKFQSDKIRAVIARHMGESALVYLFGSRVDDMGRGGDIDVYVETATPVSALTRARAQGDLIDALEIGVDIVVNDRRKREPIYDIARNSGVRLA